MCLYIVINIIYFGQNKTNIKLQVLTNWLQQMFYFSLTFNKFKRPNIKTVEQFLFLEKIVNNKEITSKKVGNLFYWNLNKDEPPSFWGKAVLGVGPYYSWLNMDPHISRACAEVTHEMWNALFWEYINHSIDSHMNSKLYLFFYFLMYLYIR